MKGFSRMSPGAGDFKVHLHCSCNAYKQEKKNSSKEIFFNFHALFLLLLFYLPTMEYQFFMPFTQIWCICFDSFSRTHFNLLSLLFAQDEHRKLFSIFLWPQKSAQESNAGWILVNIRRNFSASFSSLLLSLWLIAQHSLIQTSSPSRGSACLPSRQDLFMIFHPCMNNLSEDEPLLTDF